MDAPSLPDALREIQRLNAKLKAIRGCLVAWRCWKCGHELLNVPPEPFGPCPACGMDGFGHGLFCDDREELVRLLAEEPPTSPFSE